MNLGIGCQPVVFRLAAMDSLFMLGGVISPEVSSLHANVLIKRNGACLPSVSSHAAAIPVASCHIRNLFFISWRWPAPTQPIGILLPELVTPFPDDLIRQDDATGEQQFFDLTVAETEAIIEPHVCLLRVDHRGDYAIMGTGWEEGSTS
jgi:hypothetical protein